MIICRVNVSNDCLIYNVTKQNTFLELHPFSVDAEKENKCFVPFALITFSLCSPCVVVRCVDEKER